MITNSTNSITITPEGLFLGILIGFGIVALIGLSFWILLKIEEHMQRINSMERRIKYLEQSSVSSETKTGE